MRGGEGGGWRRDRGAGWDKSRNGVSRGFTYH